MAGTARKPMSVFDMQNRLRKMQKDTEALIRQQSRVVNQISTPVTGPGASAPERGDKKAMSQQFSGIFETIFGIKANVRAIVSGNLDLSLTTAGDDSPERGLVFVSPESGNSDVLDTITGNVPQGAVLWITGVSGNSLVITHDVGASTPGRILCPGDTNVALDNDDVAALVQDITSGVLTWRLFTTDRTEIIDGNTRVLVDGLNKQIDFNIDGLASPKMRATADSLLLFPGYSISLNGNILYGEQDDDVSFSITADSVDGWEYRAKTGDTHQFIVGGDFIFFINSDGAGLNNPAGGIRKWQSDFIPFFDDTYDLGSATNAWADGFFARTLKCNKLDDEDGTGDIEVFADLEMKTGNTVDFADSAATAGASAGFVIVRIAGVQRKIEFYAMS